MLSLVQLFVTPGTIQSMEFSRPEYWSGLLFPSPGDLPNPGIEPRSPALQVNPLPAEPPGKPKNTGVVSLSLLQQIFLTQEIKPGSPALQEDSLPAELPECHLHHIDREGSCWTWSFWTMILPKCCIKSMNQCFWWHMSRAEQGCVPLKWLKSPGIWSHPLHTSIYIYSGGRKETATLKTQDIHRPLVWKWGCTFNWVPGSSAGKESTCNARDLGSIPGLGRCFAEGNSYPLQYSGLENSMDCIVPGVAKSQTQLSDFHFNYEMTSGEYSPWARH